MAQSIFIIVEYTKYVGPDGAPGFKVVEATHSETTAQDLTTGSNRFYSELVSNGNGHWIRPARKPLGVVDA